MKNSTYIAAGTLAALIISSYAPLALAENTSVGIHVEARGEVRPLSSTTPKIGERMENHASTTPRGLGDHQGNGSTTPRGERMATSTVEANQKTRAEKEISNRITDLNKLIARIQAMKHVSDANKTTLVASVQTQITILTTLKTKIDADTDVTILKTDVQSITKSIRIYMLVMPQIFIAAASDRLLDVSADMTTVGTLLSARITEAKTAGKNTSDLDAALADYTAKIADANVQAQAAISATVSLTPDNGDKTKAEANTAALKAARAQLEAGTKDLKTARKDAETIVKGLKAFGIKVQTTATSTARLHASTTVESHDR